MIAAEALPQLLSYDPETGALTWRERSRDWFNSDRAQAAWNARYAGSRAFTALDRGRLCGRIRHKTYLAHRVAWALAHGAWPQNEIDHINGDPSDNRLANLRDVSAALNSRNTPAKARNQSGVTGVRWREDCSKWQARITVNHKDQHLGLFDSLEDAAAVRREAEALHGFHANHGRPLKIVKDET